MRPTSLFNRANKFSGLFDRDELGEIVEMIAKPNSPRFGKFKSTSILSHRIYETAKWVCVYHKVSATQLHYLNKSEVTVVTAPDDCLLNAVELLTVRHNQSHCEYLTAILSVIEKPSNGSQHKVLLKQQIYLEVSPLGSGSTKKIVLKKAIVLEKEKEYEFIIDFDSSWRENTFYPEIPYPDVNGWNGLVRDLVCSSIKHGDEQIRGFHSKLQLLLDELNIE